jgi:hypothetical protein
MYSAAVFYYGIYNWILSQPPLTTIQTMTMSRASSGQVNLQALEKNLKCFKTKIQM